MLPKVLLNWVFHLSGPGSYSRVSKDWHDAAQTWQWKCDAKHHLILPHDAACVLIRGSNLYFFFPSLSIKNGMRKGYVVRYSLITKRTEDEDVQELIAFINYDSWMDWSNIAWLSCENELYCHIEKWEDILLASVYTLENSNVRVWNQEWDSQASAQYPCYGGVGNDKYIFYYVHVQDLFELWYLDHETGKNRFAYSMDRVDELLVNDLFVMVVESHSCLRVYRIGYWHVPYQKITFPSQNSRKVKWFLSNTFLIRSDSSGHCIVWRCP